MDSSPLLNRQDQNRVQYAVITEMSESARHEITRLNKTGNPKWAVDPNSVEALPASASQYSTNYMPINKVETFRPSI